MPLHEPEFLARRTEKVADLLKDLDIAEALRILGFVAGRVIGGMPEDKRPLGASALAIAVEVGRR